MKKKYLFFISLLILFVIGIVINHFKVDNVYEEENLNNSNNFNKGISMNLEQTAGAGDYKTVTQSEWPTSGYIFNSELSRCENGSTLSWDDTKKTVIMQGNVSDKCYVYFDKYMPPSNLAEYVVSKYTGVQGENDIYYHDSYLENGAGDNSYRYAGANPNNYVCFGSDASPCPEDNLYRIIGVINGKVKLIKSDFANSNLLGTDGDYKETFLTDNYKRKYAYYWNYKASNKSVNTWSTSLLNITNLNTNFLTNIGSEWADKIALTTWKVGGNIKANIFSTNLNVVYENEIINPIATNTKDYKTTYEAKIGLMYISDYGYASNQDNWTLFVNNSAIKNNNWIYQNFSEWTITRIADGAVSAFYLNSSGNVNYNNTGSDASHLIRPVFYLTDILEYNGGDGTVSNPIRIS